MWDYYDVEGDGQQQATTGWLQRETRTRINEYEYEAEEHEEAKKELPLSNMSISTATGIGTMGKVQQQQHAQRKRKLQVDEDDFEVTEKDKDGTMITNGGVDSLAAESSSSSMVVSTPSNVAADAKQASSESGSTINTSITISDTHTTALRPSSSPARRVGLSRRVRPSVPLHIRCHKE